MCAPLLILQCSEVYKNTHYFSLAFNICSTLFQSVLIIAVIVQKAKLRQQLSELRQRYARAKQTMKAAQEKLDANSRKKEELLRQQRKKTDETIIAESE